MTAAFDLSAPMSSPFSLLKPECDKIRRILTGSVYAYGDSMGHSALACEPRRDTCFRVPVTGSSTGYMLCGGKMRRRFLHGLTSGLHVYVPG